MRSIKHWTPRYIASRILEIAYQKKFPDKPWLNRGAINIIEQWLKPEDIGAEFGSGRSTLWISNKVTHLISLEHNIEWYKKVSKMLEEAGCMNVDYIYQNESDIDISDISKTKYIKSALNIKDNSLDFALVDGNHRSKIANIMVEKLKIGGLLILDNANRYLPSNSFSPNSRSLDDGPINSDWEEFMNKTESWRSFWTSDGVNDTAFFVKIV